MMEIVIYYVVCNGTYTDLVKVSNLDIVFKILS